MGRAAHWRTERPMSGPVAESKGCTEELTLVGAAELAAEALAIRCADAEEESIPVEYTRRGSSHRTGSMEASPENPRVATEELERGS